MTTNSQKANIPQAELTDAPNIQTYALALGSALDQIVVPKYPLLTDRDTANPSPTDGDMCYVAQTGENYVFTAFASDWVGMRPRAVSKLSNSSRTSTTTLSNDSELFLALEANSKYIWEVFAIADSTSTTPGVKFAFSMPSGSTMAQAWLGATTLATAFNDINVNLQAKEIGDATAFAAGAINGLSVFGKGVITTASTADNLILQWAQFVSSGTATNLMVGSTLTCLKIS